MIIWAIVTQDTYNKLKKGSSVFCMIEDSPWGKTMSSVTKTKGWKLPPIGVQIS